MTHENSSRQKFYRCMNVGCLNIILFTVFIQFLHIDSSFAKTNVIEEYYCNKFGYIVLNKKNKTLDIYKINQDGSEEILSKCRLKKIHKDYFIAKSIWPGRECIDDIEIKDMNKAEGDSVTVTFNFNRSYDNFTLIVNDAPDYTVFRKKIEKRIIKYVLKKNTGIRRIAIQPDVNPFSYYLSWGDNKTMGVLKFIGVPFYVKENDMEISFNNFNTEIFKLWYLDNAIILRDKNGLLWNDKYFIKKESGCD